MSPTSSIESRKLPKPEIMAPAGDEECFLAALAAQADGIYLGLKNFSARMLAQNFGLGELARLVKLAHEQGCKVYVAMNNLLKESELEQAFRLLSRLATQIGPDGIIVQDLAMFELARQAHFTGSLILSTLANVTCSQGLAEAMRLGASRVVLPRELSIDEMKLLGEKAPDGLDLECFVHGALCYCVSGRCYWSSYMGGHSGLRGRCAQPCRRLYTRCDSGSSKKPQPGTASGLRLFSCQDLELAPVIKALFSVPNLSTWKIEGRKKGPHYVFHAVTAYRILRDEHENSQARKMALDILEMALGRPGVRGRFLPQRQFQPMAPHDFTSSGKFVGKITFLQNGSIILKPHLELKPKDILRIGVQDEKWHCVIKISHGVPKRGTLQFRLPRHKTPKAGTPVFLVDRREKELTDLLKREAAKLASIAPISIEDVKTGLKRPKPQSGKTAVPDLLVLPALPRGKPAPFPGLSQKSSPALWLSPRLLELPESTARRVWIWLPPAIWPEKENECESLLSHLPQRGFRRFALNAPWQRGFFPEKLPADLALIAGPFCNIANSLAIAALKNLGFSAAIVSPELAEKDFKALPKSSCLPLGVVIGGHWPVGVSRFGLAGITAGETFASPYGEKFWSKDREGLTWIYPSWQLDLTRYRRELERAGYSFFAWICEKKPAGQKEESQPGLFNWNGRLL